MAKIVEMIYVEANRGTGEPGSPCRIVPQWWSLEGELLFEKDPLPGIINSIPMEFSHE